MDFSASPDALADRFARCLPDDPEIVRRKMFGWPAAFVHEHMFASLHRESVVLRLAGDDLARFLELDGARPFEPMPGRPMTGYYVAPAFVAEDDAALRDWLARAFVQARTLPPKPPKKK